VSRNGTEYEPDKTRAQREADAIDVKWRDMASLVWKRLVMMPASRSLRADIHEAVSMKTHPVCEVLTAGSMSQHICQAMTDKSVSWYSVL
jgi:hypothetical protein